ncbi:hypothetical protein ONS95_005244 [Cadophora gregata]|uniref:uncharacterized protein n=1 Tax=Cadophora gregata TaxID=51156 RepID=UPI0026DA797E|nr:uncharacterized protein ONS95_005244 [Cadophora gregata]KAK0103210.1 hypothetical protein ONS95_005244 [Cadophora gregata]KAK0107397.1 hypothetical protein ONS96_003216 [Cadophora gregata f. sp. sojae]
MPSYAIVGASRGLGLAWLDFLSKDSNNTVIGLVRDVEKTKQSLVEEKISNVHIFRGDLADRTTLKTAAASASEVLPNGLDVIIINGVYVTPETNRMTISDLAAQPDLLYKDMHTSLDVNVLGSIYAVNAFLPLILKGTQKKIIFISSGHADIELPVAAENDDMITYATIKGAVNMIAAKYAAELKPKDVKVISLSPGLVATSQNQDPTEEEDIKYFTKILGGFKKVSPYWNGIPLTPAESVGHQFNVIENLTMADTGKFLSHWGNKTWL